MTTGLRWFLYFWSSATVLVYNDMCILSRHLTNVQMWKTTSVLKKSRCSERCKRFLCIPWSSIIVELNLDYLMSAWSAALTRNLIDLVDSWIILSRTAGMLALIILLALFGRSTVIGTAGPCHKVLWRDTNPSRVLKERPWRTWHCTSGLGDLLKFCGDEQFSSVYLVF